jgi:type III restriction enzyme
LWRDRSDESRRLRFVLDTIGRTAWPGDRPPEEYVELVEKLNRKAIEAGEPIVDPRVPPGRDVRCIVSVAMLTEGWDATTVTHIVGLRPFESQLLCAQVIGRGLRRSQYHDLSVEEVAKVYGVSFELIPLKATPGTPAPPPRVHHVQPVSPARDHLEITFPRVEGYAHTVSARFRVAWERVPELTLDSLEIPDAVKVKGLSGDGGGRLSLMGPGATDEVTLDAWRRNKRVQELEFELARALTQRMATTPGCALPPHSLFTRMLAIVRQFLREKVVPAGGRDRRDVFLEPYFSWAAELLVGAIVPADGDAREIPRYEAHRGGGSTRDVDFWTSRPVREVERSHLNYVVADTDRWEQSAAFHLDRDEHVVAFAKNAGLGFAIPYAHRGETREYLPDFLVRVRGEAGEVGTLILETKGYDPAAPAKVAGAQRWVAAVNAEGSHGRWAYRLVSTPSDVPAAMRSAARELAAPPGPGWQEALARFVAEVRQSYRERFDRVVLYGSRARGEAGHDSDVDILVVLDRCEDFWAEFDRVKGIATRVGGAHDIVISALPVGHEQFERDQRPLLVNARREGRAVS